MKINIKNFKSIKNISVEFSRVNVLIGEPNSGKSNLLEALFLFGLPRFALEIVGRFSGWFCRDLFLRTVRITSSRRFLDLFYRWDCSNPIKISIDNISLEGKIEKEEFLINGYRLEEIDKLSQIGNKFLPTRLYSYRNFEYTSTPTRFTSFLLPTGGNLGTLIREISYLRQEMYTILENEYELIFFVGDEPERLHIVDKGGEDVWPELIAEGLKRFIYFYTALVSNDFYRQQYNQTALLLLEEPEERMFPNLIEYLAKKISESKNFFLISTHNPFLLFFLMKYVKENELKVWGVKKIEGETKLFEVSLEKAGEQLKDVDEIIRNWEDLKYDSRPL